MKFSERTISILQNFAAINQSMEFKKGKNQYAISHLRTILAFAEIEEEIDRDFCLYDLKQFLGVLSTMTNPSVIAEDSYLMIVDENKTKVKLGYADPDSIRRLEKEMQDFNWGEEFILTQATIERIYKFSGLLKSQFISIISDGESITVNASLVASLNADGNISSINIGESASKFNIFIDKTNFVNKIIPMDYKASIFNNKLLKLENKEEKLKYLLAGSAPK